RFRPGRTPWPLANRRSFRFLFVGGTVWRKGIDVLLLAYVRAFRPTDDVCLVVKDAPPGGGYDGKTDRDAVRRLQAMAGTPEIEYLEADLDEEEMARLYAACH